MGFFFGFALPVERLPILVVGPAITAVGLVLGYLELRSPGSGSLGWCATDLVAGLAITIYGFMERRRRFTGSRVDDAAPTSDSASHEGRRDTRQP
jgi:hypothetical protein